MPSKLTADNDHTATILIKSFQAIAHAEIAGKASLFEAVKRGDLNLVRWHILAGSEYSEKFDNSCGIRTTALHIGAQHGNFDVCHLLLDHGADVNMKDR